jgi:membrane protease YdiL (CAAX protease family)
MLPAVSGTEPLSLRKITNPMLKGSISAYPLLAKVLILVGIFLIGEFVFSIAAISLIQVLYPQIDFYNFFRELASVSSVDEISVDQIHAIKLYQLITSIGRFILVPLLFLYLNGQEFISGLHLNRRIKITSVVLIILIMFTAPGVINLINEWNQSIVFPPSLKGVENMMRTSEEMAQIQTEAFLSTETAGGFLLNILIVGIIASIGEEILFRGILQNLFWSGTRRIHLSIWLTAFLFSFIHFQFYGFFPRLLLGALLGYLYYWSGSLWSCIIAHFVNNAASVTGYFLLNREMIDENIAESASWLAAAISLPLVILLLLVFRRNEPQKLKLYGERMDDGILDA